MLAVHHGQRPAPAGNSRAMATLAMTGRFRRSGSSPSVDGRRLPSSPPRTRAAGACSQRSRNHRTDEIPRTMVPGCLNQQPAGVGIAGLGDRPLHPRRSRRALAENQPDRQPILLPVSRSQSPISTLSANAVSVLTPRRHDIRRTIGVNSLSPAISAIDRHPTGRRAFIVGTCS